MEIYTLTFSFIIYPLSFVNVSSSLNEPSFSIGSIISPVPLIKSSVFPHLSSHPMTLSIFPLSVVNGSIVKFNRRLLLKRIGVCELKLSKLHIGIFDWFWADLSQLIKRERSRSFRIRSEIDTCCLVDILASFAVSHCLK